MDLLSLPGHDVVGIRAENPGPFTLTGTNTWIVGRDPAWVIDPGPALQSHLEAVEAEVRVRGGAAGILLSHDHLDHIEAAPVLSERLGVALHGLRAGTRRLHDEAVVGPFVVVATPGHAVDHVSFVMGDVLFSGDAVLGEGSVFISPDAGALRGYLSALERLRRHTFTVLCPAHGPLVFDVDAKLRSYIEHRLYRERLVLKAIEDGITTPEGLLEAAWPEVPDGLRPAAMITLAAHLDKLAEEDRLPEGVGRPQLTWLGDS